MDVSGNQAVTGNGFIRGNLDVSGNQAVTGNVNVFGNEYIRGNLDVSGNIATTQDMNSRNVYATGNYYLNNYVLIPAGTVIQSAAINVPLGWFDCDGNTISNTTYSNLFDAIGYTYGRVGDDFKLPDLRGRACIGAGQGSGLSNRTLNDKGGTETHTLTVGEMPSHTHSLIRRLNQDTGAFDPGDLHAGESSACTTDRTTPGSFNTLSTGSSEPHNNMQPFIALRFLIKY